MVFLKISPRQQLSFREHRRTIPYEEEENHGDEASLSAVIALIFRRYGQNVIC